MSRRGLEWESLDTEGSGLRGLSADGVFLLRAYRDYICLWHLSDLARCPLCGRYRWMDGSDRSKGGETSRTRHRLWRLSNASDPAIDFAAKRDKIDRFCQERLGAALQRFSPGIGVAI